MNTEHEKICLAFEKAKKIHLEQHKEMEKQIEKVRYYIFPSRYNVYLECDAEKNFKCYWLNFLFSLIDEKKRQKS